MIMKINNFLNIKLACVGFFTLTATSATLAAKSASSSLIIKFTSISGYLLTNLFILGVNQVEPNPTVVLIVNLPTGFVLSNNFFSKSEIEKLI